MEIPGMLTSSMVESFANLPASLFDSQYWGPIVALFVLVVLYLIAFSVGRQKRNITSALSELSEIRTALKKIQWSLDRLEANRPPDSKEDRSIQELRFRLDDDRSQRER